VEQLSGFVLFDGEDCPKGGFEDNSVEGLATSGGERCDAGRPEHAPRMAMVIQFSDGSYGDGPIREDS
jgi:hypothetical protein